MRPDGRPVLFINAMPGEGIVEVMRTIARGTPLTELSRDVS